ncbi:hemolysin family protein [Staphylococcus schleiferi]|uniref:hemolysin family protein n=1 Tax=Staphylococcus schleiferi TaxID=1295 RepID=UPI0021D176F9|nr:CNNM domain-containing protein [Staphylococcus schleiferi]UXR54472.1 CNNM domain-containing protein [Staphylococcus schleiferi]UXR56779.1 CNNM domain-containing protein [Staphylococcus schleiferi]UXR59063.1 CNNM domain-containing protein [Staphylococcus schleiferi]UXR61378.1 CNNM domain-containing protein [Staphylococcus schleiferi]
MIIAIILLIFVSCFFSGSETALTAANRVKLKSEADQNNKKSANLLKLLDKPSAFITTILIGNNIANILLPTLVTILAVDLGLNVGIASAILTVVIIVFAEVIPKSIAATFPDPIARLVFPIIRFFVIILKPITVVLNAITDGINRLLSRGQENQGMSKEEVRTMVSIAGTEGAFNEMERNRIQGVMNFDRLKVNDINNTPRVNVTSLSVENDYDEVYDIVTNHPYTRYPVYEGDIDHVVGVFHSKYLLAWSKTPEKSVLDFCSESLFVYEHNRAEWVLRKMTITRKHMAIVLDEYGGTDAIVTHEDLIEEMLGMEIEDEMDREENDKLNQVR